MKKFLLFFVLFFASCDLGYRLITPIELENGYSRIIRKGITFEWQCEGDSNLNVLLSAPTEGWVAVGLKSSTLMKDADITFLYVTDTSNTSIFDCFGTNNYAFMQDVETNGSADYSDYSGIETNAVTTVSFTIPLSSGDPFDRDLSNGIVIRCFLAYGEDDELTNVYEKASFFGVEL